MTPRTPAVGQPLDAESVRLLVKGDWLRRRDGTVVKLMIDSLPDASGGETFLGRPDQDGWIRHEGGEIPVRELSVDVRKRDGSE